MNAERKIKTNQPTPLFEDEVGNYHAYCPADHQGTHLFLRGWVNPSMQANRKPILLLHDWSEDSTIFSEIGNSLNLLGFNTYAFDQRGHGLSGQSLHEVFDFKLQVQDILQIVNWIKYKERTLQVHILSQGLSCFSARKFATQYPKLVDKLILVEPLEAKLFVPNSWKLWLIKILAEIFPNVSIPNFLRPSAFSRTQRKNKHSTLIETLLESGSHKTMSAKLIRQYAHELKSFQQGTVHTFKEHRFSASTFLSKENLDTDTKNSANEKNPFQYINQADKLHLATDYATNEINEFTRGLHESLGVLDSKIQKQR